MMNTVFQYVVQFVCGSPGAPLEPPGYVVSPGTYRTAINVYNPTSAAIDFRKNVAVSYQEQPTMSPGPVSDVFTVSLGAGQAVVIDYADIVRMLGALEYFHKGFVVIESVVEIDVVAVYTTGSPAAPPAAPNTSLHIERVPPRQRQQA